ncbi:MAG: hypothetical protein WKG07_20625, partial [Hymenobacter sp.]
LIRTAADADHATWLFRLNYDRLRGAVAGGADRAPAGRPRPVAPGLFCSSCITFHITQSYQHACHHRSQRPARGRYHSHNLLRTGASQPTGRQRAGPRPRPRPWPSGACRCGRATLPGPRA